MLPEEQNPGRKLVLLETIYHLSGKEPVIFVENHTKEDVEISLQQRLGTIHSLDIVNRAWLKEELRGRHEQEVGKDDSENLSKNVNSMHESDYPTEEIKKKFTHESFK